MGLKKFYLGDLTEFVAKEGGLFARLFELPEHHGAAAKRVLVAIGPSAAPQIQKFIYVFPARQNKKRYQGTLLLMRFAMR